MHPSLRYPVSCALVAWLVAGAGCAHLPAAETAAFSDAFADVARATHVLLEDHAAAAAIIDLQNAPPGLDYPLEFSPEALSEDDGMHAPLRGFREAVEVVGLYCDALTRMAGNDRAAPAHFAQSAARLAQNVAPTSPESSVAALVSTLLDELAQAADARRLRSALAAGAPTVQAILEQLIAATPEFYRLRVAVTGAELAELETELAACIAEIERVAGDYALPSAGSAQALLRAEIEVAVAELRTAVASRHTGSSLPVGARPFDRAAEERLVNQWRLLRGLGARRNAQIHALNDYHRGLAEYVATVRRASAYFAELAASVDRPSDARLIGESVRLAGDARDVYETISRSRFVHPGREKRGKP